MIRLNLLSRSRREETTTLRSISEASSAKGVILTAHYVPTRHFPFRVREEQLTSCPVLYAGCPSRAAL